MNFQVFSLKKKEIPNSLKKFLNKFLVPMIILQIQNQMKKRLKNIRMKKNEIFNLLHYQFPPIFIFFLSNERRKLT